MRLALSSTKNLRPNQSFFSFIFWGLTFIQEPKAFEFKIPLLSVVHNKTRIFSWICTALLPLKAFCTHNLLLGSRKSFEISVQAVISLKHFQGNIIMSILACIPWVSKKLWPSLQPVEAREPNLFRSNLGFKARFRRDRNLSTQLLRFPHRRKIQYTCKQTEEKYPGKHFLLWGFMQMPAGLQSSSNSVFRARSTGREGVLTSAAAAVVVLMNEILA